MTSGIDWPGLLKWSLNYQDGTRDSHLKPMTDEKKRFLAGAIEQQFGGMKDPKKACAEAVDLIDLKDVDGCITSLSIVHNLLVEDPDLARNLHKIGALDKIVSCLTVDSDYAISMTIIAMQILSESAQNNPDLQIALVDLGIIKMLCEILKNSSEKMIDARAMISTKRKELETQDPPSAAYESELEDLQSVFASHKTKRQKTMTCLSNIIRHNEKAEQTFANYGGLTWLRFALQKKDTKFNQSSLLLLDHMLASKTIDATRVVKAEKNLKGSLFDALNKRMLSHSIRDEYELGEFFAQAYKSLWASGGDQLPKDKKDELVSTVNKKIESLQKVIKEDNESPGNEGDWHQDYSDELNSLQTLIKEIQG